MGWLRVAGLEMEWNGKARPSPEIYTYLPTLIDTLSL